MSKSNKDQKVQDFLNIEDGPIGCPETSVQKRADLIFIKFICSAFLWL
jgi:hypothetical protein